MRIRHIEVFHAVMEAGTISAAAARMGVSQPSLTKTLQQAELEIGYPLFDRVKGRLQPTEEAKALYQETARAYAALRSVRSLARRLRHGVEGQFRIASTPSLGLDALPDAIAAYVARHPRARFEVSTQHSGEILAALGKPAHGFDLGFTFGAENAPSGVATLPLGSVPIVCVAKLGALKDPGRPTTFAALAELSLVGLEESEPLGRLLDQRLRELGVSVDATLRVQTYQLACALAARGGLIAVVDAMTALNFVQGAGRGAVELRAIAPEERLPVTAVYPLARGLPLAARAIIECFQEALAARNRAIERALSHEGQSGAR